MGCPAPSTIIVDLNANAVDIACRLGSLVYFLEAAEELQTCKIMVSSTFRRHSRKIISLIEVARKTLTAAGISLYMFRYCSPTLVPFRIAYVKLLEILKERRCDVDATLQGRIRHLLQPLSSGFVIQRRGDPTLTPLLRMPPPSISGSHNREPLDDPTLTSTGYSSLMPPPGVLPIPKRIKKVSSPKHQRQLWDPDMFISPRSRRRVRSPDIEQENEVPPPRFVRPIPRRFGIFCTGKSSMLSQERVGRPRAPRALVKD